MSLLDSVISAVSGKTDGQNQANPLIGVLGGLLTQSGGVQGLMDKFSQGGLGNIFSSWVGTGANQAISADQIQNVLGSDKIKALAAKLGIDPNQASQLMAENLPKIIDRLTPAGKIDPSVPTGQGLAAMLPSLIEKLTPQPTAKV
jgi:uncharacterized protein YidB (DUF937 family)